MKVTHFISGMTAGIIVGGVASYIAATSMNGKMRRDIKSTATNAARTVGEGITNAMNL